MARSTTMPAIEVTYRTVSCDLPNGSRTYSEPKTLRLADVEENEYNGLEVLEGIDEDGREVSIKRSGRMSVRTGGDGPFKFAGYVRDISEVSA